MPMLTIFQDYYSRAMLTGSFAFSTTVAILSQLPFRTRHYYHADIEETF